MLMVLERQAIEGERLLDILLDPGDELWVAGAPFGDPDRQISAGLLDRTPVVEPAQLLQAVVVGLARQVVEGVAQESGHSTSGRRPRRGPRGRWREALHDRRRRRTRRHGGLAGASRGGSPSRMSGSRGWPSRRR